MKISLKFVSKCPINNIPTMAQIMAWHRPGDKPLSEIIMFSILTHICVARPQWVKWQKWEPVRYMKLIFATLGFVFMSFLKWCFRHRIYAFATASHGMQLSPVNHICPRHRQSQHPADTFFWWSSLEPLIRPHGSVKQYSYSKIAFPRLFKVFISNSLIFIN